MNRICTIFQLCAVSLITLGATPGPETLQETEAPKVVKEVELPKVVREVKPSYTADAMRAGVEGTIVLQAVVLENGTVGHVSILRSLDAVYGLDEQAVDALKQWLFIPGRRAGRPVPVLVTVELTFTLRGQARLKESGPVLGPAGTIARRLVGRATVVPVPARGKVKYSIYKEVAPTFSFPDGSSTVVLLRLPNYTASYRLTITSFRQDVGTPEIFVPIGIYLDEQFQTMGGFTEDQLLPGKKRVVVTLTFGEAERRLRYILLYTRGNLLGQHVATEGSFTGGSTPKRRGFTLSKFGLERTVRSVEAKMEIERK